MIVNPEPHIRPLSIRPADGSHPSNNASVENPPIRQAYQFTHHPSVDLRIRESKIPRPILNLVPRRNNEFMSQYPNLIVTISESHRATTTAPRVVVTQLMSQQRMSLIPDIVAIVQSQNQTTTFGGDQFCSFRLHLHLRNILVVKNHPGSPSLTLPCQPSIMDFVHGRAVKTTS